jgi:hypothetical protein
MTFWEVLWLCHRKLVAATSWLYITPWQLALKTRALSMEIRIMQRKKENTKKIWKIQRKFGKKSRGSYIIWMDLSCIIFNALINNFFPILQWFCFTFLTNQYFIASSKEINFDTSLLIDNKKDFFVMNYSWNCEVSPALKISVHDYFVGINFLRELMRYGFVSHSALINTHHPASLIIFWWKLLFFKLFYVPVE